MKSKSDNMRLFDEARTLRETVRSGLHRKATNGQFVEAKCSVSNVPRNINTFSNDNKRR